MLVLIKLVIFGNFNISTLVTTNFVYSEVIMLVATIIAVETFTVKEKLNK